MLPLLLSAQVVCPKPFCPRFCRPHFLPPQVFLTRHQRLLLQPTKLRPQRRIGQCFCCCAVAAAVAESSCLTCRFFCPWLLLRCLLTLRIFLRWHQRLLLQRTKHRPQRRISMFLLLLCCCCGGRRVKLSDLQNFFFRGSFKGIACPSWS